MYTLFQQVPWTFDTSSLLDEKKTTPQTPPSFAGRRIESQLIHTTPPKSQLDMWNPTLSLKASAKRMLILLRWNEISDLS